MKPDPETENEEPKQDSPEALDPNDTNLLRDQIKGRPQSMQIRRD